MAKFKNLPFKERLENLWYYYKWHLLACIFVILASVLLISSFLTREKYVFNVSLVGYYDPSKKEQLMNFENEITKLAAPGSDKRTSALVDLYETKDKTQKFKDLPPSYIEKLSVKMQAKEVDILIINKDDFNSFVNDGTFLNLDNVNINNDKVNKLVKSNSSIYGISIEDNKLLKEMGYDTKNKVIGILVNTKNKVKSVEVLNWILKY